MVVHGHENVGLTRIERRRLRQLERGLRAADPAWCREVFPPRGAAGGVGGVVNAVVATGAVLLLVLGALAGHMFVVFAGVLLGVCALTGYVCGRR